MDEQLINILVGEVERQAKFGVKASVELNWGLHSEDSEDLWYSLQNLLVAAGNVSKLLWPARPESAERGRTLREILEVPDDSPLQPRRFRNHFEHYDERLEGWAQSSAQRNYIDSCVGPLDRMFGTSFHPEDYHRNFDPGPYVLTFRGDTYELRPIIGALRELVPKAHAARARPYSDP
jgi:hypothetical protein